jgi:hypothetical protein
MPYVGKIDEKDPTNMFPADYQKLAQGPPLPPTTIPEYLINTGQSIGASHRPLPSQDYMAKTMQGIIAQGGKPPVPQYLQEQPTTVAPVRDLKPQDKNTVNPNQSPNAPLPAQPTVSPWAQKTIQDIEATKGVVAGGYTPSPQEQAHRQEFIKNLPPPTPEIVKQITQVKQSPGEQLESRIRAMLPGATTKQIQTMMMTVAQHRFNAEAQRDAQNQVTPAKPTYHTVNPGQTMLEMGPHGAREIYRSASKDDAGALPWKEQVKDDMSMYKNTHDEYKKNWDDITKNVPDEPHPEHKYLTQKQKALHDHNTQYFTSLGVDPDLAAVHESRELFLKQMLKPGETMSAEEKEYNLKSHALLMKKRREQMKKKYSNTLNFTPGR